VPPWWDAARKAGGRLVGQRVVFALTEWPQFRELNWTARAEQAAGAVVVDTRNVLDPAVVSYTGLIYRGNGTPSGF
jgi:UDPglucose 6-dehydrogenase